MAAAPEKFSDVPHNMENASDHAHGAHGKGDSRENAVFPSPTMTGNSGEPESGTRPDKAADAQTSKLSDAAWGAGAAGGSVADKRPPKHPGSGGADNATRE